jgi:hypothetical protein
MVNDIVDRMYIIGYVNPDTDLFAMALGLYHGKSNTTCCFGSTGRKNRVLWI